VPPDARVTVIQPVVPPVVGGSPRPDNEPAHRGANGEAMSAFVEWLLGQGVDQDTIELLLVLAGKSGGFETPDRIMEPDSWFHFPGNTRFIRIGNCPNGDGIGIDMTRNPGPVYFIDHERLQLDDIEEISVRVADSLQDYVQKSSKNPDFPYDYHEAKGLA